MPQTPYVEDGVLHYTDSSGADRELVLVQDSAATKLGSQVATRFTNVNLQRRVETEAEENNFISIHSKTSYRTVIQNVHDEDSTTSEIP